jgi:hypothetical protein
MVVTLSVLDEGMVSIIFFFGNKIRVWLSRKKKGPPNGGPGGEEMRRESKGKRGTPFPDIAVRG